MAAVVLAVPIKPKLNMDEETHQTYLQSAQALAEYYQTTGVRKSYVDEAILLTGKNHAVDILELGCGSGRDASYAVTVARSYTGIDYSKGMIAVARRAVKDGNFLVSSMQDFSYPAQAYDVVLSFASVLHLDQADLQTVMKRVASSLRPGGIFYISTKYARRNRDFYQTDRFGKRRYYYYNKATILKLAQPYFRILKIEKEFKIGQDWLEVALQKC